MSEYKHGAYAFIGQGAATGSSISSTLPIYFGVLPVQQIRGYSAAVNQPIMLQNEAQARALVGYCDDWEKFDLCEPIFAHFMSGDPIGPILVVNVLDPKTHVSALKTVDLTLVNGQAEIITSKLIIDTAVITDKAIDVDYGLEYSKDGMKVIFKALKEMTSPVTLKYKEVNVDAVNEELVIGTTTADGVKSGIDVTDLVYTAFNKMPTLLLSPKWGKKKAIYQALIRKAQSISGHFHAFVPVDIDASADTNTIAKALAWKEANGYTSADSKPCWPKATVNSKIVHLSVMCCMIMMGLDLKNNGIPSETPSNKEARISGLVLNGGEKVLLDQVQANQLNERGITTGIYFGGKWVLWGPHTGAYDFYKEMDPRDIFDATRRMLLWIKNDFQVVHGKEVDGSITRSKIMSMLNSYQERLDGYVNSGHLAFAEIKFLEANNSLSDLINGDFDFDIHTTGTPIGKSISAKIYHSTQGLATFFGGE